MQGNPITVCKDIKTLFMNRYSQNLYICYQNHNILVIFIREYLTCLLIHGKPS